MQSNQLQPLSAKELEYIVDSISNEELLIKQTAATCASSTNPAIQQACQAYIHSFEQHLDTLIQTLRQHQNMAPNQPQQ